MNFASDNTSAAAPEIMAAIAAANEGSAMPYGNDPIMDRVRARVRENWREERRRRLETCRRAGVDLLDVPTEGSVVDPLLRFFRMRELRGARR